MTRAEPSQSLFQMCGFHSSDHIFHSCSGWSPRSRATTWK